MDRKWAPVMFVEAVTPIEALTIQERVYQELRRLIMSGHFAPGEALTIRSLAESLGTSAQPVREALHKLSADQAVLLLPNRSIHIPFLSRSDLAELCEIRRHLEGLAAARTAEVISDSDIETLESLQELSRSAMQSGDPGGVVEAYRQFCFKIFEWSDSSFLQHMISGLWLKMGPTRRTAILEVFREGEPERYLRATDLVAAMRTRNSKDACEAMRQNVDAGERVILQFGRLQESD